MTINAGDIASYPMQCAVRERIELELRATVTGGAGVIVTPLTQSDDPQLSIVRGGSAGLYNLTFPKSADARGLIDALLISPAGTVKGWFCTAADFAAGTASIQTVNAAGASTDPAAADSLIVSISVSKRRDF